MKHYFRITAIVTAAVCLLAACFQPLDGVDGGGADNAGSAGIVRISLPLGEGGGEGASPGRTVLPDFGGLSFALVFTSAEHEDVEGSITNASSGEFVLKPGTWQVAVEAKHGGTVIAEGSGGPIHVQGGKTVTFGVGLEPLEREAGAGALDYTVAFPESVTAARLELISFPGGVKTLEVNLINQPSDRVWDIPAGYYRLIAHLTSGTGDAAKIAGRSDIVHIYKGLISALDWSFAAGDFSEAGSYFTALEDLEAYLAAQPLNTAESPYAVKLRVNMAGLAAPLPNNGAASDSLGKLYRALRGRYVELDLSDSFGDIPDGSFVTTTSIDAQRPNAGHILKLTLPSTLKSIGNYAFYATPLKALAFPASLEKIGTYAFMDSPLTEFDFSHTKLAEIGDNAFYRSAASSILLGDSVTKIGVAAFSLCHNLTEIDLSPTLTSAGKGIFSGSANLARIGVSGTGPLSITEEGFLLLDREGGKALIQHAGTEPMPAEVIVPSGVVEIADGFFQGNTVIVKVVLPEGLKRIGANAFLQCSNLEGVNLPSSLESIGNYAFGGVKLWADAGVVFPAALKELGDYAFGSASSTLINFARVDLSRTQLTHIGAYAFSRCAKLTEVKLPPNLKSIGKYAFYYCNVLGNTAFPDSLESIGEYAFAGAYGSTSTNNVRTLIDLSNTKVTSISDYAFTFNTALASARFPPGLKHIGARAFNQCKPIAALEFPASLESIGESAFTTTTSNGGLNDQLTTLVLPAKLEWLGSNAFTGMSALASLTLPASLVYVGPQAFSGCAALSAFTVTGAGPLKAGDEGRLLILNDVVVAAVLPYTETVTVPEGVTKIGPYAFYGTSAAISAKLTAVAMPASLTLIDEYAFQNCASLASITFPQNCNLKTINSWAFRGCAGLADLDFSNTKLENILSYAAYESGVERVILPATMKNIGGFSLRVKNGAVYTIHAVEPPSINSVSSFNTVANTGDIKVPAASVAAYKEAWTDYADKITAITP
ncbi:MAG: leucine-rich repeat domain-containing protein [Treponema sp.]|jgi:hypothetical protein|nr:leucine-rich repeat domain-containing protein [Treponema sp.]